MRDFMTGMVVGAAAFAVGMYVSASTARAQMPRLEFVTQQNTLATHALACLMAEGLKNEKAMAALNCATFFDPPAHNAGEEQ